ncbi:hypothetical protein [Flavobacterium ajazii]|uniref:hypothetical protein n=1 Tax=Flavobacterium ajazii TaxID=2692318 RepID=UPI0013D27417|nr:hypothetical protein [Flavobacterium ajazii]
MKKVLKIIAIILGFIILIIGTFIFIGWRKMQKLDLAQEKANYIMDNLDRPNIGKKFPIKYFPREKLDPVLKMIRQNCDWKNKDGKFVDFFTTKNINGTDQTAFIYEYYMRCDSLRFILSFNVEDDPELMGLNFEPLEKENSMIIFPEKQLKYRK